MDNHMSLKNNWILKNLLGAVVLVIVLLIGISVGLNVVTRHGKTVTAPDFTNLTVKEATLPPYDSAMRSLVVAIYELGVEEVMVIHHSTCGACHMCYSHLKEAMLERGISEETLSSLENGGTDLEGWLEGFHDTEKSVRDTVAVIRNHPLMPADLIVRGFVIDSVTGELTEIS